MRVTSLALALLALAPACGPKKDDKEDKAATGGSAAVVAPAAPPVAVAQKPLPPLAANPEGATGKPARLTTFGGLGIDSARGVAVAADGAAYLVGYFDADITFPAPIGIKTAPTADAKKPAAQAFVVKVGSDGKIAWVDTWGGDREDTANAVAVNGGTIAVAGNFYGKFSVGTLATKSAGSDDAIVAAYDDQGTVQWVWNIGGIDSDGANAIAAAPDGGWVVGGSFSNEMTVGGQTLKSRGGTDGMLIKLKATGELEWIKQFGGAYQDQISHVAVDGNGNIVIQGVFRDIADWGGDKLKAGGGSDNDVVLAKYDLNGTHLWSQRFGNAFNEVAGGVTIDPSGFITMVGSFDKSVSFGKLDDHKAVGESDIFVSRFSPTGELQWAKTFGADREDIASGVATDAAGNTVTTGWFQNSVNFGTGALVSKGNKDIFALKLDVKGDVVWAQRFGDKDHDQGRAIALDAKGNTYLAGIYRFTLDPGAGVTAQSSVRADADRIPKPDSFLLVLER